MSSCCPARLHPARASVGAGVWLGGLHLRSPCPRSRCARAGRGPASAAHRSSRAPGPPCRPLLCPATVPYVWVPAGPGPPPLPLPPPHTSALHQGPGALEESAFVITLHIATAISNLPCTFTSITPFNPAPQVAARTREIIQAKLWYRACPTVGTCKRNSYNSGGGGGRRKSMGQGGGGAGSPSPSWARTEASAAGSQAGAPCTRGQGPSSPTPPSQRGAMGSVNGDSGATGLGRGASHSGQKECLSNERTSTGDPSGQLPAK